MKTLRVLVADDHRLMLAAVRRALADADDFEIVHEVSVGSHVVPAVRETSPDVVLLDLRMPELDGLACLERLQKHDPDVAVVILSSYSDPGADRGGPPRRRPRLRGQDRRARRPGRRAPHGALRQHLHRLGRGGGARSGARRRRGRAERARDRRPRSGGARALDREIGRQLWISEQTVKFHLRNVYRKLGISSRTEAARYAYRTGRVAALTVESA